MPQPTLITLSNESLSVVISDFGARLLSARFHDEELLYGPKSVEDMLNDSCYCGAICGRVANRIAKGHAPMSNGETLSLPINNGENHLHGGIRSFADKLWMVEAQTETDLILSLISTDGDEGYPGTLEVRAHYKLDDAGITLRLEAISDKLTLINLTHHAYWNLGSEPTIVENHTLRVEAENYTPMVENIPTGEIASVADSPFDLRDSTALSERIGDGCLLPLGYDDNFCLNANRGPQVTLQCGDRSLCLWTDAPAVQVYTGYYLPQPFGGVALEPQSYPDAPNKQAQGFPSIELQAGVHYARQIRWCFK